MADLMVAIDESAQQCPDLRLSQKLYAMESQMKKGNESASVTELKTSILADVEGNSMEKIYVQLCSKYSWDLDEAKVEAMRKSNEASLAEIATKEEDAIQNAGDTEVLDCMFLRARHYTKVGEWSDAFVAFDAIIAKPKVSTGKKIDATMEKARISLFSLDLPKLKELIAEAKRLIDLGGDWDRRNRLKVYEALYLVAIRDLKGASSLLMDCIATFTCVEICSYKQFMFYALLACIMSFPRTDLKTKVVNNPHVITIIRDLPAVKSLLESIYQCDYSGFFKALLAVHPDIVIDRYTGPHAAYIIREFRILAYAQFLEAYKSVLMSSMAQSFGLSLQLLDEELSRFIAAGRLSAKIDKVGDVIETVRPDKKNLQYQEVIKKGDVLLNSIQKLVRAIEN